MSGISVVYENVHHAREIDTTANQSIIRAGHNELCPYRRKAKDRGPAGIPRQQDNADKEWHQLRSFPSGP